MRRAGARGSSARRPGTGTKIPLKLRGCAADERGMGNKIAVGMQSALCGAKLWRRGIRGGIVRCEGRLPVVRGGGTTRITRLVIRGYTAPVEFGAKRLGKLTVGERVFINQGASIVAEHSITIGDDTLIGDFVAVYDTDHHPVDHGTEVRTGPVTIGRNVWIGRGAIILPGVTIGDHAVVAAGSVVNTDVAPRTLVAGTPAKLVRSVSAPEGWRRP